MTFAPRRSHLDSLEPRLLMAADSEFKWMIQQVGGATTPSPNLTVATNLPTSGGYARTTNVAAINFSGAVDSGLAVKVNGVNANTTSGAWSLANAGNALGLSPGINRVQVRAYDAQSVEVVRTTVDVWHDDGSVVSVSGTLNGNNTWTAAGGPYLVTANTTIAAGGSLTIEPGASVYFRSGTKLIANGRLDGQGTDLKHIRFTRDPVQGSNWSRFELNTGGIDHRISYADVEYASTGDDDAMRINGTRAYLDHVHFRQIGKMYLDITNASIDVRNSIFPGISSAELIHYTTYPAGAFAAFDRNTFGIASGYNDVIDFTGGQRPGTIVSFTNNWFTGAGDDGLDLDSTDAWIEGNVFMNFHQDGNRESKSHAVTTGNDLNQTAEVTIIRNFFYDVDHAILIKDGAFGTIVNNTISKVYKKNAATDATTGAINLFEPRTNQYQGVGVHVEGNIFHDISRLFELIQPFPAGFPNPVQITANRNIFPVGTTFPAAGATIIPGVGNIFGDPLFVDAANVVDPTISLLLQPNSPGQGTGPNGVDMGADVPHGVSLSGEPAAITNSKSATLNVAFGIGTGTNAAGYLSYKYKINNGAYGAETPIGTPISLSNLADGTFTVYAIGKNDAGNWQNEALATASKTWTVDTVAPKVSSATFNRGAAHSLTFVFNEDVGNSIAKSDFTVTNRLTNQAIAQTDMSFDYDPTGRTGTITYTGLENARLPDGRYRVVINANGVSDLATNALDGDANNSPGGNFVFDFHQLAGDANADAMINHLDFNILYANFGQAGGAEKGDMNFDGVVNFTDFQMLERAFGTTLPTPACRVLAPAKQAVKPSVVKRVATKKPSAFATRRIG